MTNKTKLFTVGGCVRDMILGIESMDIDFAVESASFDSMRDSIVSRGGTVFLESPEFLTIRAKMPGIGPADFVLCRKDGSYSDGRHPDSVEMGTLSDDLARRDFTMNAIAQDEDGTLIDPHNGQSDIASRRIVCVGDAATRFTEDALRLLRAVRFSITKSMELDDAIVACLSDGRFSEMLVSVSDERIREELTKAFMFDTVESLRVLERFPLVREAAFGSGGIRLEPTMRQ